MSGPAPKPSKLKTLEGNPGKRPLPLNEPRPAAAMPACPAFIKGSARKEWQRLAPELYQLGLLTRVDRAALAGYCIAWEQFEQADQELARLNRSYRDALKQRRKNPRQILPVSNGMISITSNGNAIMEPLLSVRKQALELMHKFLTEFGMTPASRSRIVVAKDEKKNDIDAILDNAARQN
jgi:P27 family predicted phage terminase small subunit